MGDGGWVGGRGKHDHNYSFKIGNFRAFEFPLVFVFFLFLAFSSWADLFLTAITLFALPLMVHYCCLQ